MNAYNFTERVRRVLGRAREEAVALHHEYLGCEHMLLALLADDGVASVVIQNLGVELPEAERALRQILMSGRAEPPPAGRDLPYTSSAKRTLEFAMEEARELNHSYVGTEHLLLGLMRERRNIGAQVLTSLGLTFENAREETLRILGTEIAPTPLPPPGETPKYIGLTLRYSNGAVINLSFRDAAEAARYLASQ
jgi:ATP-dependent Clp protease ATP-binding subunit ClpC